MEGVQVSLGSSSRMMRVRDDQVVRCRVSSNADMLLDHCDEERAELEGKAPNLDFLGMSN